MSGYRPQDTNHLVAKPGRVIYDPALSRNGIAIAVILALCFIAAVVFGAIWLSHFWTPAPCTTVAATAAKTTYTLAVEGTPVLSLCPIDPTNCSLPSARMTSYATLYLTASSSLEVGLLMTSCTTVGQITTLLDGYFDTVCNYYLSFLGTGGITAGSVSAAGTVVMFNGGTNFSNPITLAVTGGAGPYARPIGGDVVINVDNDSGLASIIATVITVN